MTIDSLKVVVGRVGFDFLSLQQDRFLVVLNPHDQPADEVEICGGEGMVQRQTKNAFHDIITDRHWGLVHIRQTGEGWVEIPPAIDICAFQLFHTLLHEDFTVEQNREVGEVIVHVCIELWKFSFDVF